MNRVIDVFLSVMAGVFVLGLVYGTVSEPLSRFWELGVYLWSLIQ